MSQFVSEGTGDAHLACLTSDRTSLLPERRLWLQCHADLLVLAMHMGHANLHGIVVTWIWQSRRGLGIVRQSHRVFMRRLVHKWLAPVVLRLTVSQHLGLSACREGRPFPRGFSNQVNAIASDSNPFS